VCGPLEADPEYQLIVEANNVTVEIDNEISKFYDVSYIIHYVYMLVFLCGDAALELCPRPLWCKATLINGSFICPVLQARLLCQHICTGKTCTNM